MPLRLTGWRCNFPAVGSNSPATCYPYHDPSDSAPLSAGRNLRQCHQATEVMFNMHLQPPTVPSLKRKSFGDISEQLPKRQAIMSPIEPQAYATSRSFGSHGVGQTHPQLQPQPQVQPHHQPYQAAPLHSLPQLQPQPPVPPINIQPRPAPNGITAAPTTSSPTVLTSTPTGTGRKRGRPSKADKEAWARANAAQQTGYAPITPAPIAPQPASTQSQPTYSPSPVGQPAYQISSTAPASDTRPKKRGRPSTADKRRSESVPRSIQPIVSADSHKDLAEQDTKSEKEEQDWVDRAGHGVQRTPGDHPVPTPLEPPIHQSSTFNRHSGSPFAPGALREGVGPVMEHARNEGQAVAANQS